MAKTLTHDQIRRRLQELLDSVYPGIDIAVEHSSRWNRLCLTFRHPLFARLLPEQRFRALVQRIPGDFYEQHLRSAVWLELAPGETADDVIKAKRSQDVAKQQPAILRRLSGMRFLDKLREGMGHPPESACLQDFNYARRVLTAADVSEADQLDICLLLIHLGAFCDCQVFTEAMPVIVQPAATKASGKQTSATASANPPTSRKATTR